MSNEKLIAELRSNDDPIDRRVADALAQADKEIAELRKNDKRYRWLRAQHQSTPNTTMHVRNFLAAPVKYNLDAAIDAAMPEGE